MLCSKSFRQALNSREWTTLAAFQTLLLYFLWCTFLRIVMAESVAPQKVSKHHHELRDAVHVFIHFDSDERRVLNSRPLQRLRYIHQLALSYLIYPGATHRR